MTSKEIALRILEKYNSTITFKPDLSNGKLSARPTSSSLRFDITDIKPKNTEGVLDWFLIDKGQMVEVVHIILKDKDFEIVTNRVNEFIRDKGLTDAKELYLVPYLDDF